MKIRFPALVAAVAMSFAAPASPAGAQERVREEFEWSGAVQAGRSVEVHSINGGIRAFFQPQDFVIVLEFHRSHLNAELRGRVSI